MLEQPSWAYQTTLSTTGRKIAHLSLTFLRNEGNIPAVLPLRDSLHPLARREEQGNSLSV